MKKLLVFSLAHLLATALVVMACTETVFAQQMRDVPRCNIGNDPVDVARQPTADEEILNNPTDKVITYSSGSGRDVTCTLQVGAPVVVNKVTGIALWVYGCGNEIRTPWTPKRPPATPLADSVKGLKGDTGATGPQGPEGPRGPQGRPGKDAPVVRHGHKKLWVIGGVLVVTAITAGVIAANSSSSSTSSSSININQ